MKFCYYFWFRDAWYFRKLLSTRFYLHQSGSEIMQYEGRWNTAKIRQLDAHKFGIRKCRQLVVYKRIPINRRSNICALRKSPFVL